MEQTQILSINKLSSILGLKRDLLQVVAQDRSSHYRPCKKKEVKKDGRIKYRKIDNPSASIRSIQRKINKRILSPVCEELPAYMTGGIRGRSIIDNAEPHVGKDAVLCLDIEDCYPSISSTKVYDIFRSKIGCSPPVAKLLTRLTTYGNRLPQGAPTSGSLCNLALENLSKSLHTEAANNGLDYTHYVDDLTFSGESDDINIFKPMAIKKIQISGFGLNQKKITVRSNNQTQSVTGLIVNRTLGAGRKYVRKIERMIFNKRNHAVVAGSIAFIGSTSPKKAKRLKEKTKRKS